MKRPSSGNTSPKKKQPTPDEIRTYVADLVQCYQQEGHFAISGDEPNWHRALCLHLQFAELETLESAMQEFF
jgi:hypothetical protein